MSVPVLRDMTRAGVSAFDVGAGTTPSPRSNFRAFNDCVSSAADQNFSFAVSGTGAAFSSLALGAENAVGILRAALGTTATGRAAVASPNFGVMKCGVGQIVFDARVRFVSLSDATTTYSHRAGILDSVSAESTDCVCFRYTHSVNGGRFQGVSRSNNTESVIDTGITVAINTWYRLRVVVSADGTQAEYFINETPVGTVATNIPVGAGREVGFGVMALRSVGTAAFNCYDVDYVDAVQNFTTQR